MNLDAGLLAIENQSPPQWHSIDLIWFNAFKVLVHIRLDCLFLENYEVFEMQRNAMQERRELSI